MFLEMEDAACSCCDGVTMGTVASMVTDSPRTIFFCVSRKRVTECAWRNRRGGADAGMIPRLSRNWTS